MIKYYGDINNDNKEELKTFVAFLENYFDIKNLLIKINVLKTREEFNKEIGKKTPDWMVGYTISNNIYVLSPEAFEKESNHKRSEFVQIIKHEISHVFIGNVSPLCLKSLEEGLCLNFAGQNRTALIKKENFDLFYGNSIFYNLNDQKLFADLQGYQLSYMMVKNLLNKFNKNQITELIKIERTDRNWKIKIESITSLKIEEYVNFLKSGIAVKSS